MTAAWRTVPSFANHIVIPNHIDAVRSSFLLEFQKLLTDTTESEQMTTGLSEPITRLWPQTAEELNTDLETNLAPRILIAVSDTDLRRIAVTDLRASGFCVSAPTDAEAAIMLAQSFSPDVLLVDARQMSPTLRNAPPLAE